MKYTDEYIKSLDEIQLVNTSIESFRGKSFLITGANGLICSAVIDSLIWLNKKFDADIKIYAAARSKEKIQNRFYKWKLGEDYFFYRYDAMSSLQHEIETDYIIHGASNANPGAYAAQPAETMLINFFGIYNLLELCKKNCKGRLLYISSSEVYGKKGSNQAYAEDDYGYIDILNPRACYPSSKRMAETLCASYKKEYDVEYVIVRPGHIYGPTMLKEDNRAASEFIREVHRGKDIVMKSNGEQLRSYCYVIDCVTAILTVLLNGKTGEAYNISNPSSVVTIREFAETLARITNTKLKFEVPSLDEKNSYNLMNNSSLDSKKIYKLGWRGQYDLDRGLRETLESL